MLWSAYALGTRTLLWFGHGCFGQRMLSEHERYYDLRMDALVSVCSRNTNVIMVWAWMLWSAYALGMVWGMDALVRVCSRNTNVIMVWAWMLWSGYALGTRTLLWFGHGCFGQGYALGTRTLLWFGHGCFGQRMLSDQRTILWMLNKARCRQNF